MAKTKQRIDLLLVQQGLSPSREKAKAAVMAGLVLADGQRVDKPGAEVPVTAKLQIQGPACPYVSRGGLKLAKALQVFPINLAKKVVLDVGASTGGFTDCALQNGADKVYAVDVGYGQLAWSLRSDPRVVSLERTNARFLTDAQLGEKVDFATIDVAFISLDKILPVIKALLKPQGQVVALIKPQFEAGKDKVGKKGVVKDPAVHQAVIERVLTTAEQCGYTVKGLNYSPVKGPEGNIEYLAWLAVDRDPVEPWEFSVPKVVGEAHSALD